MEECRAYHKVPPERYRLSASQTRVRTPEDCRAQHAARCVLTAHKSRDTYLPGLWCNTIWSSGRGNSRLSLAAGALGRACTRRIQKHSWRKVRAWKNGEGRTQRGHLIGNALTRRCGPDTAGYNIIMSTLRKTMPTGNSPGNWLGPQKCPFNPVPWRVDIINSSSEGLRR